MTTSKPIVFFGNERLASGLGTTAPALRSLIDAGYHVAAVVVAQNDTGKSRKARPLEVAEIAHQHGIPVIVPARLKDVVSELRAFGAEAAVLAAYGKIIPKLILDLFPVGIINIHPSLLPLHRGSTPIESAIMQGDTVTGVSLMRLVSAMDAGPVYAQISLQLSGNETKQALTTQLTELGARLLLDTLPGILDGSIKAAAQNQAEATYDSLISKLDAQLNFHNPASELLRQVRAYAIWPRSRCTVGTQEVIITDAHIAPTNDGMSVAGTLWLDGKQLGMHCSEGILVFDKLIPPGKKEMSASDFLLGYKP